jgi:hypothetical protein
LEGNKRLPQVVQFLQQHFQSQEQGLPVLTLFHQSPRFIHLYHARCGARLIIHHQPHLNQMWGLLGQPVESFLKFHSRNVERTPADRASLFLNKAKIVPYRINIILLNILYSYNLFIIGRIEIGKD